MTLVKFPRTGMAQFPVTTLGGRPSSMLAWPSALNKSYNFLAFFFQKPVHSCKFKVAFLNQVWKSRFWFVFIIAWIHIFIFLICRLFLKLVRGIMQKWLNCVLCVLNCFHIYSPRKTLEREPCELTVVALLYRRPKFLKFENTELLCEEIECDVDIDNSLPTELDDEEDDDNSSTVDNMDELVDSVSGGVFLKVLSDFLLELRPFAPGFVP